MERVMNGAQTLGDDRVETLLSVARDTASSLQLITGQLQAALTAGTERPSPPPGERERELAARAAGLEGEVAQLREALQSRAVIEQAKGVLMARCGCDAEVAFTMLCTVSRTERRKVREVAASVVGGAVAPEPAEDPRRADDPPVDAKADLRTALRRVIA